jgi:hypothetical protein
MAKPDTFANIQAKSSAFARGAFGQTGLEAGFDKTQQDALAVLEEMLTSGQLDPKALQALVPEAEATHDPFLAARIAQPAVGQAGQAARVSASESRRAAAERGGGFGAPGVRNARLAEADALTQLVGTTAQITQGASQQAAQLGTQASIATRAGDVELTKFGLGTQASLRSEMSQRATQIGLARAQALQSMFETIFGAQARERLIRVQKERDFLDYVKAFKPSVNIGIPFPG